MLDDDTLYAKIENTRHTFEGLMHQQPPTTIIQRFNDLLQEDASSWSDMSSGRRSMRSRAHDIAIAIRKELGPEVLLCVVLVARTVDNMASLYRKSDLIHKLNQCGCQELSIEAATARQHVATAEQGAADALERAFMVAAQSIPNLRDREDWLLSAAAHARLLRLLSRPKDASWAAFTRTVQWYDVSQLSRYLGAYLSNGIQESCIRKAEERNGLRLTDAVRMLPPFEENEDFGLEIWLCLPLGESIAEKVKHMTSIEEWETILGNSLYTAMLQSKFRKSEEERNILRSSAARISFPDGRDRDHDSKLAILISFEYGTEIWSNAYPKQQPF